MALKLTKLVMISLAAAAVMPMASVYAADGGDLAYYTITSVQTHEIPVTPTPLPSSIAAVVGAISQVAGGSALGGVSISAIVNAGEQIWSFIQANAPVASITVNSANAIPRGVRNWEELTGWQAPQMRAYETTFTNGFGMTVAKFDYQVSYTPGGSYRGEGAYLMNITVEPQDVMVAWGYKLNAQVTIPSITNVGTAQSPVAAAQVVVQWTMDTILKHEEQSETYYIRGDGEFQALN